MGETSVWRQKLVAEWNRCHGAFYRIRESDLAWQEGEQTWLRYFPVDVSGVPLWCAEATERGIESGISRKTLWVSLWGRADEAGPDFSAQLDRLAPSRGKTRLCLGGDEFHLLPGIPRAPEDGGIEAVAERLGFQFTEAVDYAGPLRTDAIAGYIRAAREAAAGLALATATEGELAELGEYLRNEFPGRWEREFRFWRALPEPRRAFWNILRRGSRICGFSRLAIRGSGEGGWHPGSLRLPVRPGTVDPAREASLGPIGISLGERGRGAGKALLGLSLQILLDKNAEQLCIDWTNAYNYYMPLGLEVVRRYRTAHKDY